VFFGEHTKQIALAKQLDIDSKMLHYVFKKMFDIEINPGHDVFDLKAFCLNSKLEL